MKKPRIIILLSISLALVLCASANVYAFFRLTDHQLYTQDGFTLNARVYFSKLEFSKDGNAIQYTVKNDTRHDIVFQPKRATAFRLEENGEWVEVLTTYHSSEFGNVLNGYLPAFEERHAACQDRSAGGILLDEFYPGTYCVMLVADAFCVIGYVTYPENPE